MIGNMSLKHFGLKRLEEVQEVIYRILKSLGHAEATIGLRSRVISIARVGLRLRDFESIIPKSNSLS